MIMPMVCLQRLGAAAGLGAMVLLSSCAPARVQMTDIYAGPRLPRPDRVVVSSFTVSAQDVKPDQGAGPRLLRAIEAEPYSAAELQEARKAQAAVVAELVKELQKYGLAAEPGGATAARAHLAG